MILNNLITNGDEDDDDDDDDDEIDAKSCMDGFAKASELHRRGECVLRAKLHTPSRVTERNILMLPTTAGAPRVCADLTVLRAR